MEGGAHVEGRWGEGCVSTLVSGDTAEVEEGEGVFQVSGCKVLLF